MAEVEFPNAVSSRIIYTIHPGFVNCSGVDRAVKERSYDYCHEDDVHDGFDRARQMIRESNLRSLPFGPLVVYELVRLEGGLVKGRRVHELYEQVVPAVYADRDQEPVGYRSVTNSLAKLVEYDLLEQHGETRWAEYEAMEPELKAPVEMDLEEVCI